MAVVGATLGAFMALLNIQIVNAAVADIQGAIGAGPDDVGWISTAYLVAEIVVIPLTGWLAAIVSVRRYMVVNAVLFLLFSVACGFARSLEQMIALRVLQGMCGGALIPMAYTLIMTMLPAARQPIGICLLAVAATVAPAIGPTIGGWLSEHWGWQLIFCINLVPGAAMLVLLGLSLERQPMQPALLRQGDWAGIATVAIGLGTLQIVLEEGNKQDWFDSQWITGLAVVSAVSLALFVWIELRTPRPLLNLRLLLRRNFGAGMAAMLLVGVVIYGSVFVLPLYLARVQGYTSEQIGLVLAWTGLPQLALIPVIPLLMTRFDARWLVAVGLGLFALGNFMNMDLTVDVAGDQLLLPNVVRALGQILAMTPLIALATAGIPAQDAASASAVLNVARNLGGAVGIALLQTILTQRQQVHADALAQSVSSLDQRFPILLDQLARHLVDRGLADPGSAWRQAVRAIADQMQQVACTMAFGDTFFLLGSALVLAMAAALVMRRLETARAAPAR
jgi:DHA2 family multidrug resistance protein